MKKDKEIALLGRVASLLSIMMYVSYIPQIMNNLNGQTGSAIQPFVAMLNCTIWTLYASLKQEKDWPIIFANVPGIILGFITFYTAIQ